MVIIDSQLINLTLHLILPLFIQRLLSHFLSLEQFLHLLDFLSCLNVLLVVVVADYQSEHKDQAKRDGEPFVLLFLLILVHVRWVVLIELLVALKLLPRWLLV